MPDFLTLPLLAGFLDGTINVFYVILGVGFLIFVHELGHFAVAKWSNVKVEAFSLGFGPCLKLKRGETEYRLSLIPLGGYVKMAGEGLPVEGEEMDPGELRSKGTLARAAIFSAGVVMNAVAGFLIFAFVFAFGVDLPAPVIRAVEPGSAAWKAGLEPGDRIVFIDGHRPIDWQDMIEEVAYSGTDEPLTIRYERDGEVLERSLRATTHPEFRFPTIGITPRYGMPFEARVFVPEGSSAFEAGLRSDDRIVEIDGHDIHGPYIAQRILTSTTEPVTLTVERGDATEKVTLTPVRKEQTDRILGVHPYDGEVVAVQPGSSAETIGFRAGDVFLQVADAETPNAREFAAALRARPLPEVDVRMVVSRGGAEIELRAGFTSVRERERLIASLQVMDHESSRFSYVDGSTMDLEKNPVRGAGIPEGSRILRVGDRAVTTWSDLRQAIADSDTVTLTWRAGDGEERTSAALEKQTTHLSGFEFQFVQHKETVRVGLGSAVVIGFQRSVLMGRRVLQTIGGIFSGSMSGRNLAGPISIFTIAKAYSERGVMELLLFLGLLSVNLAILNLLPIPILDGGHLLFLLIEKIKGSPVQERTFALAQWVGLILILALLVYVTFNDIMRLV